MSINARGIANETKRRIIFDQFRKLADVLVIIETHSIPANLDQWQKEWGGKIIMSHGESNARGVALCTKRETKLVLKNIEICNNGRYIIADIEENDVTVTCAAIYAPNKDCPAFFTGIAEVLRQRGEHKIIIGDFNVVLDISKDRLNTYNNNEKAKEEIDNIMSEFCLKETWRERNPDKREFSWKKSVMGGDGTKASRIDYALISAGLDQKVENILYVNATHTDHRAMFVVIDINYIERGTGYWKLNTLLLTNKEYIKLINEEIDKTLKTTTQKCPSEKWEKIKERVKKMSQQFSRNRTSEDKLIIAELSEIVNEMQSRLPLTQEENNLLENTQKDLEEKMEERIKGVMFRSKARWYEYGEKGTKYFFSLEKAKYNAKTCYSIYNDQQELVSNPKEILSVQKKFYEELYSEDKDVEFTLKNQTTIKVPPDIQEDQNRQISISNLEEAIKQMNNNRTPGEDGIPVDFYKVFWCKIKHCFYDMMIQVYQQEQLHQTARTGILNLIPKPNKDTRHIKNLRPITLLNCDYKIIEKAIANKMVPALKTIIHQDQRGFMKDRRISVNIRKLLDIIHYTKEQNIEALILSLDFVKCFDKCSFSILHGSLEFFQFGDIIKNWTKILYKDFQVKIQNNGFFSTMININKGVHQGGCCSSIYFLIIAEILAMALRRNEQITGLTVHQIRNLLNQFADDADVFSENSEQSLTQILQELEDFRKQSGFTISYDKTVLYRIGSLRHSSAMMYNIDQVAWSNEDITVLGITIAHENLVDKNYSSIQNKVRKVLNCWENRGLTLSGKVLVVNTLIMSLFIYKMMVLPTIPEKVVKSIENEIRNYLWDGGKAKIAFQILKNPFKDGGLNLTDLKTRDMALKATWPQILAKETEYAKMVFPFIHRELGEDIWRCHLRPEDVDQMSISNEFWRDVLKSWCTFNYWYEHNLDNQQLWFNSRIRVALKPVFWKIPYQQGLIYIHQLFLNGKLKSAHELKMEFQLSQMQYNSLMSSIPTEWKEHFSNLTATCFMPLRPQNYDMLKEKTKLAQMIYQHLNGDILLIHNKAMKWNQTIGTQWDVWEFAKHHQEIKGLTNYTKMRDFQYRLLQKALITNIQLEKWNILQSNLCTFCNLEPETIMHLLVECNQVKILWNHFAEHFQKEYNTHISITPTSVITNTFTKPKKHIVNTMGLFLKQYIYRQRCLKKTVSFIQFEHYALKIKNTERYIAIKNNKIDKHERKWEPKTKNPITINQEYVLDYLEQM